MAMYLMKPYYDTRSKRQTTTFATFSTTLSSSYASTVTDWTTLISDTNLRIFSSNYKLQSTVTYTGTYTYITWAPKYTTATGTRALLYVTRSFPKICITDLVINNGSIYSKWASNGTSMYFGKSPVTTGSTFAGNSEITYQNNTSYGQFIHYGGAQTSHSYLHYTKMIASSQNNVIQEGSGGNYGVSTFGYYELSDPYKVTLFTMSNTDVYLVSYSHNTGTMYKATLTEV